MAADFDFDGTFNDDADDEDEFEGFDEDEEDEEKSRPNILRIIILVLFVLVLLCVVCGLIVRSGLLPISIPGLSPEPPPPAPPAQETPVPEPTDAGQLPPEEQPTPAGSEEETVVAPTEEAPVPTEPIAEATQAPAEQATEAPTEAPTEGPTVVITVEPVEPTATAVPGPTATPMPGPTATPLPAATATPGPTVVITITPNCDNNLEPVADAGGPYTAMRGKGRAIVNFDGANSTDSDGNIVDYEWDFGDDSPTEHGAKVSHGYSAIGSYEATLTVTDDCGAIGQDTAEVTIVGPTPPATGTPTTATPAPSVTFTSTPIASATMGFCYRVQYGDTLSGVAWKFGVRWADLATVNHVPMGYFVIAGQGLFIPTDQITPGPNVYRVLPGDTMQGVAWDCGLSTTTLARANGLSPTASLTPGQTLVIPVWKP